MTSGMVDPPLDMKKARFDFHQNELFSVPDGGPREALVEPCREGTFQQLHVALLASLPITAHVVVEQQLVVKQEYLMDKALYDPASVVVLGLALLRLRELPKQKLDLLGGDNDVGGLGDSQLGLNRLLLVFQLGKSCGKRLCDDPGLDSFEGILDCLLDFGQLVLEVEHVAVVLAIMQLHFIAFLADVLDNFWL